MGALDLMMPILASFCHVGDFQVSSASQQKISLALQKSLELSATPVCVGRPLYPLGPQWLLIEKEEQGWMGLTTASCRGCSEPGIHTLVIVRTRRCLALPKGCQSFAVQ